MTVIDKILSYNAGREAERLQIKYDKLRANPFAFFRGTCHLFYPQLPSAGLFASAPLVWTCGDVHLENFGSYKGDNRLVYFDLNDFDEAALAPASWELARMLTSIRVWGHCMALKPSGTQKFCDDFLTAYIQALAAGKAYWIERETAHGLVAQLLGDLRGRERADFLDHRTVLKGKRRHLLLDGKRALPASAAEREQVSHWLAEFAQSQPNPGFFKVLDLARRVAGTGSLGLARYVILVQGKGSPERNYLLDLKQSVASSLAPTLKAAKIAQPAWASQAHRVVAVQRRLQAVSAAFLQPVQMNHHAYVLRGLQPSEDRVTVDLATHSQGDVSRLLADMGHLLAWAQLRSAGRQGSAWADELIAFAGRKKMPAKLLDASQDLAEQALSDAQAFNAAYDDKALA